MSLLSLLMSGCGTGEEIRSVSSDVFSNEISQPGVQLLDVRTADEFNESHIEGAVNIDVQSQEFLQTSKNKIDLSQPVYIYCRSGKRSMMAAEALANEGYKVVNLDGGILDWVDRGYPVSMD